MKKGINAVVIGGGTGTFTVLSSLKHYVTDVSAIVNMVDDGGSTGVLRDELGVLPPGDIRQCLVALSDSEHLRELFNYRFSGDTFGGHSFGNLFLTALEKLTGSFDEAVRVAADILNIQGSVIPVTTKDVRLCLKLKSGKTIVGEKMITDSFFKMSERPRLSLRPGASLNVAAARAIAKADLIIIGPGNLYSSLVPPLLVRGIGKALRKSKATKVFVSNLVTKPGQTKGFKVHDFVDILEEHIGGKTFDYVIYNTAKPHPKLLRKYAAAGEEWVPYDQEEMNSRHYVAIGERLISREIARQNINDHFLKRTLIRHDSDKLARTLVRLYWS